MMFFSDKKRKRHLCLETLDYEGEQEERFKRRKYEQDSMLHVKKVFYENEMVSRGLSYERVIVADGNCLYRCFSYWFYETEEKWQFIKDKILSFAWQYGKHIMEEMRDKRDQDATFYLHRLQKDGAFGDATCLFFAAQAFGLTIYVAEYDEDWETGIQFWCRKKRPWHVYKPSKAVSSGNVYILNKSLSHFSLLKKPSIKIDRKEMTESGDLFELIH